MNTIFKTWQKSLLTLITGLSLLYTSSVQSQIIPDNTLGNENSKFTPNQIKDLIEGGAIRGNNLFHSFSEFNINNNQQVYFTNPSRINNILTRVTGNNISNIFGTLGVNGNANLFLINPNGIIFGQNAKLDVKGSFLASTANAIKFADNTLFSAKNTNTTPLLTMSVPIGVQFGNNPTGDITSNGNLTTGKDLTLSGKNINIKESILQTGGNLTLESQEKIKIEDSINKPVILKSAGDIIIQGNQSVKINALNHNDSNITSDRDITFRSPVRLLSNGKYTVGGYFVTEDLNQNVIDFLIPHNNVIKVNGDVTLGNYTGSSLYILTSGKVTLGNVTINDVDNTQITQDITDGQGGNQTVIINSKNDVGILDVRAGIDAQKLPKILENNQNISSNNADIKTGDIKNSGGNVLLINQYKTNSQLGNITIGNINTSRLDERNGGAIAIFSGENITTKGIYTYSYTEYEKAGYGGAIILNATGGNITTEKIDNSSFSSSDLGNAKNAGYLTMFSKGNIITENIDSSSYSYSGNAETGGAIAIVSGGNITTGTIDSYSYSYSGNAETGGAIAIVSGGNITIKKIDSSSFSSSGNAKNGGAIALFTTQGNIATKDIDSRSYSDYGNTENGGNIALFTTQGNITTQDVDSRSFAWSGNAGNGGNIALSSTQGNIITKDILSYSRSISKQAENGGNIALSSTQGNIITQTIESTSYSFSGNVGNGGNITLKISEGNMFIPYTITSSAIGTGGNGGTIQFTGDKLDINNMMINSNGRNGSNGGLIKLNAPLIQLTNSDISSSSYASGNSGQIELNSTGDINLNNSRLFTTLEPGSTGNGGNINIQTQNLNLSGFSVINTGTYSTGNAGNININAENVSLINGSSLQSLTTDKGNAGNIFLNVPNGSISLINSSSISTSATNTASGNSGNITLDSRTLSILNGSQIQALTEGIVTSKAGNIIVNVSDNIIIGGVDPNFVNPDPNALPPQNIVKSDGSQIKDIGSNNSITTAQKLQASDFYLNNPNQKNDEIEYTTRVPYTSIHTVGDGKIHVYAITVNTGTKAVFDIDNTGDNESGTYNTPDYNTFPAINTKLTLFDSQGKILDFNDDNSHGLGAGGSYTFKTLQQDPYLRYTFTQGGTYYIQVSNFDDQGVPSSYYDNYSKSNQPTSYDLQISLDTNPIKANLNNQGQPSGIFAYTTGAGKAGNINLNTNNLKLESGGSISAFTNGSGTGGTININANNSVNLGVGVQNFVPVVSVETNGAGKAGDIIINTPNFILSETARITATATKNATNTEQGGSITLNANKMNLAGIVGIFAETQGAAPAGTLKLNPYQNQNTLDLTLFPGSIISASTSGSGNGGDFQISANDTINITGKGKLAVETKGTGNAGNILISTQNLNIKETEISANTTGSGKAGSINFNADNINIEKDAKISATTSGGLGGSININNGQKLNLKSGGQLLTTTSGNNAAGDINIKVKESINLSGQNTGFFANTAPNSTGNGGNIKIDPIIMNIENGAAIAVNSDGSGVGGNIFLQSGNLVLNNGFINAQTANSNGGGITLDIGNYLLLANSSKITSTAGTLQSGGNGGNIKITTPYIIGFATNSNHQIIANAFTGKGGNIDITTNGIFGSQYINIQASSQFGVNGSVNINTLATDSLFGLTELPSVPVDVSGLINKSCQVSKRNSFKFAGKNGIPLSPYNQLTPNQIFSDWGNSANIPQKSPLISENTLQKEKYNQQEAQGFIKDDKGNIILTLRPLQVTINGVYLHTLDCERLLSNQ